MLRLLPRSTLFPYTTLFRSAGQLQRHRNREEIVILQRALIVGRIDQLRRRLDRDHQRRGALHHRHFGRSEEHTSELQSPCNLVCRLLLEKKKVQNRKTSKV